jgi:predicted transcriptional regulator
MSGAQLTVRVDPEVLRRIGNLAKAMRRPRSYVIQEALERYLDYEEWFVQQIQEALKEAEEHPEHLLSHEEVMAGWRQRRAELLARAKAQAD